MPLDPSIPLSAKPVQVASPYDILDYQLRARQQQRLEQAADRAEQQEQLRAEQQARAGEGVQVLNRVMQDRAQAGQGFDRKALEQQMAAAGQYDLYAKIAPHLDASEKAAKEAQGLEQQIQAKKNAGLAALAYGVHLSGNTPEAFQVAAQVAKARFGMTDEDLAPYTSVIAERPDAIGQLTSALIAQDPDYAKLVKMGEAKAIKEPKTRQIETVDEQGNPIIRIVADEPGAVFPDRPAALKAGGSVKTRQIETVDERGRPIIKIVPDEPGSVFPDRPRVSGTASGLSPTSESNVINRLTTQWAKATEPARELRRQVGLMEAGLDAARRGDLVQGSQAVLVTFQKILDPMSVVRESEYARSASGLSLLHRIQGAAEKLSSGGAGVPLTQLDKFADLARQMASEQTKYLGGVERRIKSTADRYKIPHELVVEEGLVAVPSGSVEPKSSQKPSGSAGVSYQDYLASRKKKP